MTIDNNKIWERFCAKFSFSHGIATFNSWIKPLEFCGFDGGVAHIKAPTRFIRDWVLSNFGKDIEKILIQEIPNFYALDIIVGNNTQLVATEMHLSAIDEIKNQNTIKNTNFVEFDSALDQRFKFENFITAETNNFAFQAAQKFAEGETLAGSNCLFIYGNVGYGKTHLLQAIAHYIKENLPEQKAIYLSAEKFMFQFVKAIREKDTVSFKEYLRSADILLIDDIQFICGKAHISEEFIHTFNAIIENGRKIVLSANRAPSDFDNIDERIKSRLGWGLVADIRKADNELRYKILQKKAAILNEDIAENVLKFLSENISTSIRELEGALNKIVAQSRIMSRAISIDFVAVVLKDLLRSSRREITIDEIKRTVCNDFSIKIADIESAKRSQNIARPRQVAMYLAKSLTSKSFPEIGRNFGSKNHTTVMHAVKTIERLKLQHPEMSSKLEEITRKLAG